MDMTTRYSPSASPLMTYRPFGSVKVDFTDTFVPAINTWTRAPGSGAPVCASVTLPVREAGFGSSAKSTVSVSAGVTV
uniref:hypothetical protein n=1 Tax=Bacillus sp. OTU530 TaxID=3043862 RepID=UPI00313E354F